ncbi:MAG TPA: CpaD family pilus assembly protein [Pseudolabrys sp.]|nr:CpaD family pilus assembly protein [Pseudolabrys sp.]
MKAIFTTMGGSGRSALRLLAICGLAGTLAGCFQASEVAQNEYPTDYRQRHPIVLKEGVQTVEVLIGRSRGGLTARQRADVSSFALRWRAEAGSGVIIDVPQGGPTDRAAADATHEIRSIFAAVGVPPNAIYVRHYHPSHTSLASIKLNYSRLVAEAGPCGEWPRDLGPSLKSGYLENQPYWNLGCATQRNLAAMVDNPTDLVQPRGEDPPFAPRRNTMIDRYRKGENPSGTYVGYDLGKISDVGK